VHRKKLETLQGHAELVGDFRALGVRAKQIEVLSDFFGLDNCDENEAMCLALKIMLKYDL